MTYPWLDQAEVDDLCAPLKQKAAQVRYLREQGLAITVRPNGTPIVLREALARINGELPAGAAAANDDAGKPEPAPAGPNVAGLVLQFGKRKAR